MFIKTLQKYVFFFIYLMKRTKMFTIASKFVFGSIIMSYENIKSTSNLHLICVKSNFWDEKLAFFV